MPQRDRYHDAVRNALIADGWTVTNDPYRLIAGTQNVYVDLAAERIITAERGGEDGTLERIAVEVKSFIGLSSVADLEQATGQYLLYRGVLARTEPHRTLYLAVPDNIYQSVFTTLLGQIALEDYRIRVVSCDVQNERIVLWR